MYENGILYSQNEESERIRTVNTNIVRDSVA